MTDATSPLRARLQAALPVAMKAGDRAAVAALRSALSAIDHAEAKGVAAGALELHDAPFAGSVPGLRAAEAARRTLAATEVDDVVQREVDDRERAAAEYDAVGRADHADRLRHEAAVLRSHLAAG